MEIDIEDMKSANELLQGRPQKKAKRFGAKIKNTLPQNATGLLHVNILVSSLCLNESELTIP